MEPLPKSALDLRDRSFQRLLSIHLSSFDEAQRDVQHGESPLFHKPGPSRKFDCLAGTLASGCSIQPWGMAWVARRRCELDRNVHALFSVRNMFSSRIPKSQRGRLQAASHSLQWLLRVAPSYHRQRAHQQPRSGRQTQVRPSPQTGPATRQATVSIGEKFLAAVRRPKAPLPVIASAVNAKAPASSRAAEAVSRIAILRIFPLLGGSTPPHLRRADQQARCVMESLAQDGRHFTQKEDDSSSGESRFRLRA